MFSLINKFKMLNIIIINSHRPVSIRVPALVIMHGTGGMLLFRVVRLKEVIGR
jgi:hypothetical protein